MRRLGACGIGHVLGSCIVPAYASDSTGLEFTVSVAVFIVRVAAFIVSVTVASAVSSYKRSEEFKASAEGKIQAAVAEVMKPFEWGRKEKEVIPRPVIGTIKDRIKSWNKHATVIHGQLDSGRTWAVYEALRGVRGVVRFKIEKPNGRRRCASNCEWMIQACSKRSCAECSRSSKTFPTTSLSIRSSFWTSLAQPPKD